MKHYIGLDAHLTSCTFVTLNGHGNETDKFEMPTSEKNIVKYIRSLKGEKHLTFEESNLAKWLYVTLRPEVDQLVVCNPSYIAKKQGPKSDYRDALHLANELRCNHLVPVFNDEDNEYIELRALISGFNDLVSTTTRTKNQYNAIFRSQAIKTQKKSEYKDQERINLLISTSKRFVCQGLFEQLQYLQKIRKSYEDQFSDNMKKHILLKNLTSIPGISDIRAHTIASIVCDGKRFPNKHHLWSYAMLVRHHDTRDGVVY